MSFIIQKSKHGALLAAAVMVVLYLLTGGAAAAEHETLYNADYCFSAADFQADEAALNGIFVTEVPSAAIGNVRYGSRIIQPGDALPTSALSALTLSPACQGGREAVLTYLPILDDGVGEAQALKISISSGKNTAPTANDGTMETYKNIANSGTLDASDPDGDTLQYNLTSAPKRGSVEVNNDGSFTYTPAKNKVGKDSFTYTVTDTAGNVSNEATVQIEILKPIDKVTYSDMAGDPDQFTAMWLRDNEIFSGESIGGVTCFCPDKTVTRGEFLVMVAKLTDMELESAEMTSGFADEGDTPQWMRPYIVSALRAGVISGVNSENGLIFRPTANLTYAEAAVMLQNVLQLPAARETADFSEEEAVPTWAADAVSALSDAGLPLEFEDCSGNITRRDAANLLYAASKLQNGDSSF